MAPDLERPRSPLWLIILAFASEEPMHPYRMHTLIKQRGKDMVVNVAQRNSVNQTIAALVRAGLLAVKETERQENRPERTIYQATAAGRAALVRWVELGLSTPAREFPEFPAVLSVLFPIGGEDALKAQLEKRIAALEPRLEQLAQPIAIPRLFLLEAEYMAAMVRAEVAWLRAVVRDLDSGKLKFPTAQEIVALAKQEGGPSEAAVRRIEKELAKKSRKKKKRR